MFTEIKEIVYVSDGRFNYIRISKDDWYQLVDCDYVLIYDCDEIEKRYQLHLSTKKMKTDSDLIQMPQYVKFTSPKKIERPHLDGIVYINELGMCWSSMGDCCQKLEKATKKNNGKPN